MTLEGGMKLTSRPRVVGIYFYSQFLLGGKLNLPFFGLFCMQNQTVQVCAYTISNIDSRLSGLWSSRMDQ